MRRRLSCAICTCCGHTTTSRPSKTSQSTKTCSRCTHWPLSMSSASVWLESSELLFLVPRCCTGLSCLWFVGSGRFSMFMLIDYIAGFGGSSSRGAGHEGPSGFFRVFRYSCSSPVNDGIHRFSVRHSIRRICQIWCDQRRSLRVLVASHCRVLVVCGSVSDSLGTCPDFDVPLTIFICADGNSLTMLFCNTGALRLPRFAFPFHLIVDTLHRCLELVFLFLPFAGPFHCSPIIIR